jgi:hypothetical protein
MQVLKVTCGFDDTMKAIFEGTGTVFIL